MNDKSRLIKTGSELKEVFKRFTDEMDEIVQSQYEKIINGVHEKDLIVITDSPFVVNHLNIDAGSNVNILDNKFW
ncbi:hypothetical protein IFU23_24250 [Pantoea agglomerans]|uniref:Uncharacterized protein n=1 Tax=Enterobacter agglomerans TaxID=549 RepID=A0ACC5PVK0_ENTAG|nr:hypothetical protein [Pantoea agglomerans]MBD8129222.1 hypothetical protein [Pantoea agglomerans]MBD8156439.1 hypothetical protein [Pantoea agglomerans]MBD8161195.1 hypothetical protein [Pantoea agglomerans]MBD8234829.1 hypothetical protein [Pantoea agglomerans]MBD8245248.1 hypothetical protein [Pantoea agglomerans]